MDLNPNANSLCKVNIQGNVLAFLINLFKIEYNPRCGQRGRGYEQSGGVLLYYNENCD